VKLEKMVKAKKVEIHAAGGDGLQAKSKVKKARKAKPAKAKKSKAKKGGKKGAKKAAKK